jgi:hypothetical protein
MLTRIFLAVFLFAPTDLAWSQESPKAPQVEPKQQPESGLKTQKNSGQQTAPSTQPLPAIPEIGAEGTDRKGQSKSKEGSEQGTEFWPPFYGYRLKVTDTLLAGITFLLFLATFALWLATRKLVRSAEKTAQRQLGAYVFVSGARIIHGITDNNILEVHVEIKNSGQTPAYKMMAVTGLHFDTYPPPQPRFPIRIIRPSERELIWVLGTKLSPTCAGGGC